METQQEIRDAAISGEVKAALGLDPDVDIDQIHVDVVEGVVRLQGVVDDFEVKERAEDTARQISGVKGVDNALAVEARSRIHDEDISNAIDEAFAAEPSLDPTLLGSRVADGVVIVSGRVDNVNQEQTATRLAGQVRGVKQVYSELRIERDAPYDDATIHNDVSHTLSQAEDLDSTSINVNVEEAEVTLKGIVPHEDHYQLAEDLAGSVPGVHKVINRLRIHKR